jgi:molybdopterin/thiamine biosynthesis adenylyltransferase
LRPKSKGDATVTDRQERLKKYNQQALTDATVLLIGCGGLGSEYGEALVRKGIGRLVLFDHDVVELSNLNRQKFYKADLYKPKAHRLALNLSKEGFCGSVIEGYALCFEDAVQQGIDMSADIAIVGVDNNVCRVAASRYFREQHTPVLFTSVSEDAAHGFVFLQEKGGTCFGCLFPDAIADETYHPCSPAVKDILKVVGGMVSYCVDSLIMERLRTWNYKAVYLSTGDDMTWLVPRRQDCPLCGQTSHTDDPQTPMTSEQTCLPTGKNGSGL